MGKPEALELGLILLAAMATWFGQAILPEQVPLGRLLLVGSALLLLQGLIRDLSILARKAFSGSGNQSASAQCMCIESAVGAVGIIVGAGLVAAGVGTLVTMTALSWLGLVASVLIVGLVIKDYVFEWAPWRIRRDKDHMNLIFTLKK